MYRESFTMNRHLLLAITVIGVVTFWAFTRQRSRTSQGLQDQKASEQWESEGGAPSLQA
jgi:hypothetical protein